MIVLPTIVNSARNIFQYAFAVNMQLFILVSVQISSDRGQWVLYLLLNPLYFSFNFFP